MATKNWQSLDSVIKRIEATPEQFAFFQAVHLIEQYFADSLERPGDDSLLFELLKIRPNTSLACPTSDLNSLDFLTPIDVDDERERVRLTVNFLGLYGVDSPLPDFYLEEFVQDEDSESPKRRFLDVFHNRIYALLYGVWKKYRFYIQFSDTYPDKFSQRMYALAGINKLTNCQEESFSLYRLLPFIGGLSMRDCPAELLERIISSLIETPVRIESFVPRKAVIPQEQRNRLGIANVSIGNDILLGKTIMDRGSKFRVHIKNLNQEDYESLLPGGSRRETLNAVIDKSLSRPLDYEVKLTMKPGPRNRMVLSKKTPKTLGRDAWITSKGTGRVAANFEGTITC